MPLVKKLLHMGRPKGGSLAVVIDQPLCEMLGLRTGDFVVLQVVDHSHAQPFLTIRRAKAREIERARA